MTIRNLLITIIILSTASIFSSQAAPTRPNVLVIVSDDHGWTDYGFMGHPQVKTPRLDALAAQSLTFTRGYSPVPLCRPSLASITTGLYPHQHGVTGNDPELPERGKSMSSRGLPKYARYYDTIIRNFRRNPNFVRDLTSRGYVSLETGKWWEGDPVKTAGFTQAMTKGESKGSRHGDEGLKIGREGLAPIYRFLEQAGGKPWLVWYAPMLPHAPHTPPAELLAKYRQVAPEPMAAYWACVEWFDRTCGELFDYLQKTGQRDHTIILYTTDNGWIQDSNKANASVRSKLTPYDAGHRTPMMICWPGHVTPRLDKEHLASNIDLWPTLASLLQVEAPKNLPGINLTDSAAVAKRTQIFGEQYAHNIADVNAPTRSLQNRWMIDGWWKLIVPAAHAKTSGQPELYNLKDDPSEKQDLSGTEATRVKELSNKLDAWWKP